MIGNYNIVVENAYLKYEFKINRNKIFMVYDDVYLDAIDLLRKYG